MKKIPLNSATVDKSYKEFLSTLRLVGLGLKSCSSVIDRAEYFKVLGPERKMRRQITESYNLLEISSKYFDCEGGIAITVLRKDGEENKPSLTAECYFEAHIHADQVSKEHAERFVKEELEQIIKPYARQFLSMLTAQMAIPPILIPLNTMSRGPAEKNTKRLRQSRNVPVRKSGSSALPK